MKMERTYKNLWDKTKASLKGKFIAIKVFIKIKEKSQIDMMAGQEDLEHTLTHRYIKATTTSMQVTLKMT